jgi:hypothetical protein
VSVPTKYKYVFKADIQGGIGDFDGPLTLVTAHCGWNSTPYFNTTNETRDTIAARMVAEIQTQLAASINQKFLANGIGIISSTLTSESHTWTDESTYTAYVFPIVPITVYRSRPHVSLVWEVETDRPAGSLPVWIVDLLKLVLPFVIAALIAYWTIQAIQNIVNGITTTTTTTEEYGWVQNPATGAYEWKLLSSKKETAPDLLGSGMTLIAVVVVAFGALWFLTQSKKKK